MHYLTFRLYSRQEFHTIQLNYKTVEVREFYYLGQYLTITPTLAYVL